MDNSVGQVRCRQCGHVDTPATSRAGSAAVVLGLWALTGAAWAVGMALGAPWLTYVAAGLFLVAFGYSLRYLFRREQACRHCGARRLEADPGVPGD